MISPIRGSNTPTACAVGRAGLATGPRKLNTVGTPSSLRVGPAYRSAGWYRGANRKATPTSSASVTVAAGGRSITTPRASSTSAAPHADEAARLPCLIIRAPAAAATIVPIVEMLTVCAWSPPVPTRSVSSPGTVMGVACASIDRASPVISATDTPLIRSATPKPAIWDGVATPSMISFMAHSLSWAVSESPRMSAAKSAGQVVRASIGGSAGNGGTCPHQPGQLVRERDRVDRVADHGVGPGPGGEPAVVGPADDQQHRRAVVDLVLGLAAHPHPASRLRLPVEHHHVGAAGVEQPEQRRLGGDLDDLGVRDVHRGATPDGEPDLGSDIRVVAVHNDLHENACYRPPAPGGRRVSTDTATDPGGRVAIAYRLS